MSYKTKTRSQTLPSASMLVEFQPLQPTNSERRWCHRRWVRDYLYWSKQCRGLGRARWVEETAVVCWWMDGVMLGWSTFSWTCRSLKWTLHDLAKPLLCQPIRRASVFFTLEHQHHIYMCKLFTVGHISTTLISHTPARMFRTSAKPILVVKLTALTALNNSRVLLIRTGALLSSIKKPAFFRINVNYNTKSEDRKDVCVRQSYLKDIFQRQRQPKDGHQRQRPQRPTCRFTDVVSC